MSTRKVRSQRLFEIRPSPIHGLGAFALRAIPKGARIIEYTGERITPQEADARYDDDALGQTHTFLFTVDRHTVIDGEHEGNDARYINHSCQPNCRAIIEDGRVFIEAIRNIPAGTELTYDYRLTRGGAFRAAWKARYPCHCGAPNCRGTLLKLPKRRTAKR